MHRVEDYKKGISVCDSRRKREDRSIHLRRNQRIQQQQKRRNRISNDPKQNTTVEEVPTPSTTAEAPLFLTANLSAADPATYNSQPVAP